MARVGICIEFEDELGAVTMRDSQSEPDALNMAASVQEPTGAYLLPTALTAMRVAGRARAACRARRG